MDAMAMERRLTRGERLLWQGRPAQGLLLGKRDVLLIPLSLFILALALFTTRMTSFDGRPDIIALAGWLFAVFGAYAVAGRFAVDAWVRSNISYALTDRRVLISRTGPFGSFVSLDVGGLPEAQLDEGPSGRGTIRFGPAAQLLTNQNFYIWTPALDPVPQFLEIERMRYVFDLLQEVKRRGG